MRLGIGGTYIAHHMVSDTMTKAVDGFINFEAESIIKRGFWVQLSKLFQTS